MKVILSGALSLIRYVVFFLLLFVVSPQLLFSGTVTNKKIFIVHSYHETQKGHVVEMTKGIIEALKVCQPDIRFFHMDTKRNNSIAWKTAAGEKASALMKDYAPDVVIAMDDNAQEYFVKNYIGNKDGPVFVFGGVNAKPAKYGFPAENITGILERPNIRESLALLLKIAPQVKNVVLLSDKSSTTDTFHDYAAQMDLPVNIIAQEQPKTVKEWENIIEKYRDVADAFGVYVIRTIKDTETGKMADEKSLIEYLNVRANKPTVGFFDSAARAGVLCGISVSMEEQGYAAGNIACDILHGKKATDITIQPTTRGRILLNLQTAEKLGVDINYSIIKNAQEVINSSDET